MKKFQQHDILQNTIKVYPHNKFLIYTGSIVYNNKPGYSGVDLYDLKIPEIFPFKVKDNTLTSFKTISLDDYNQFKYGDMISGSYPLSSSVYFEHHCENSIRKKVDALKNIFNKYKFISPCYNFGDRGTKELTLLEIPSIFYGSSIKKGSVKLKFYTSGSLVAELQDSNRNGDLLETTGSHTGSIAGSVLYNEGFIVLTGSWSLKDEHEEQYRNCPAPAVTNPSWKYFGVNVPSSSYDLEFNGVDYIQTLTLFCHAGVGELNYSNNPTFVEKGQVFNNFTGSNGFIENEKISVKNIVKSIYPNTKEKFKKITNISKISIMDDSGEVIAIAKLSTPLKKIEERDYTIKLRLDLL